MTLGRTVGWPLGIITHRAETPRESCFIKDTDSVKSQEPMWK